MLCRRLIRSCSGDSCVYTPWRLPPPPEITPQVVTPGEEHQLGGFLSGGFAVWGVISGCNLRGLILRAPNKVTCAKAFRIITLHSRSTTLADGHYARRPLVNGARSPEREPVRPLYSADVFFCLMSAPTTAYVVRRRRYRDHSLTCGWVCGCVSPIGMT